MLYDESGESWPGCSLLIGEFERGREEDDSGEGESYFGRNATVFAGGIDLPTRDLNAWQRLGEIDTVYYDRAGTKYPGFFKHTFNKPRGLFKVIFLIKGKAAKKPAMLYTLFRRRSEKTFYRIELPAGCIVDDRGIVMP
jgi:hypothetical protein